MLRKMTQNNRLLKTILTKKCDKESEKKVKEIKKKNYEVWINFLLSDDHIQQT